MHIKEWLHTAPISKRAPLAKACGISVAYMWQLAGNHKRPSNKTAIALEKYSQRLTPDSVIWIADMRPDLCDILNTMSRRVH